MSISDVNHVTERIIGAAMRVHTHFGPGLLEKAYSLPLATELLEEGFEVDVGRPLHIEHKGLRVHAAYRVDLIVNNCVIVELKSVSRLQEIHTAQLLTYLRLCDMRVGLLINFFVRQLKNGIRRVVNELVDESGRRI